MDTRDAGRQGGQARAKALPASKRSDIARNASLKRWGKLSPKHDDNDPLASIRAQIEGIKTTEKPSEEPKDTTEHRDYMILRRLIRNAGHDPDEMIENALLEAE